MKAKENVRVICAGVNSIFLVQLRKIVARVSGRFPQCKDYFFTNVQRAAGERFAR